MIQIIVSTFYFFTRCVHSALVGPGPAAVPGWWKGGGTACQMHGAGWNTGMAAAAFRVSNMARGKRGGTAWQVYPAGWTTGMAAAAHRVSNMERETR